MKRIVLKGKNALINTAKSLKHSVTHPKETAVKLGKYIKENPDEAVMVIGSNVVPGAIAAKKAKEGDAKGAAMWTAAAAAPIGESYVIGKKGIKALLKKSKSMSDKDNKDDLRNTSLRGLSLKDQYKAKATYVPAAIGTYVVSHALAKKLGAGKTTRLIAPVIPTIAVGRLTKKAVVNKLKSKNKED